jgi:alcohol dehydrogenase, propanol-preferring
VVCGRNPHGEIPSFPYELLWQERTRAIGREPHARRWRGVLALAPTVPVPAQVTRYPPEAADEALADLRAGALTGAAVVTS